MFTVNGGLLGGNGTLGGLIVNGGTVAPGHSIGTLNVAGNVSFTGGTYQVETNLAGQSDRIAATGTATLSGGRVLAVSQAGSYTTTPITYTILTATGGVTGTFSGVSDSLAFLKATLSYDANDVFLNLSRNPTFFRDQALTRNQRAVAGALDQFPTTNPLFLAAAGIGGASVPGALDSLSGEIHASVQSTLIEDSLFVREALLGRLRQASFAGTTGAMSALGLGGPVTAYSDPANAYASVARSAFPVKAAPLAAPAPPADLTWWSQAVGAWSRMDGDGNAAGVSRSLGGFFTGVDRRFGDTWRLGIAGGYTNSSVSVNARLSAANIDTAHLAAYAGANYGPVSFRSGAAFAWNTIGTGRTILFPGFVDNAAARYGASTSQVFGEIGYAAAFGRLAIEPFAGLAFVHLDTGGFSEVGGLAALAGSRVTEETGYSSLGLRLAESFALVNGMIITPRASAYWQHAFNDVTPTTALTFLGTGIPFSVAGVPLARETAIVESGFDLQINPRAKIGVSYFGELATHLHDHAVKGKFSWSF